MERWTDFDPTIHGFSFDNDNYEVTTWVGDIDFNGVGRCGGMVYAALDYFNNELPLPPADWLDGFIVPPDGHPLGDYIYTRLMDSFANVGVKVTQRIIPLLTPIPSFSNWYGKGTRRGENFEEFKLQVDENKPMNIVLITTKRDIFKCHQVCGIGYYVGTGGDDNIKVDFTTQTTRRR